MIKINYTKTFKKDFDAIQDRQYLVTRLKDVITLLYNDRSLQGKHNDHRLPIRYSGFRECHLTANWFLTYKITENELTLVLVRTGSYLDLLG